MKHFDEFRVYYADTDAYGVVWHGTYLRWLEAGRIEYTNKIMGIDLTKLQEEGCLLPVVELNIKYKRSAKLDDIVVLETEVDEIKSCSIRFKQTLRNKETNDVYIIGEVTCVALDTKTNRMMRRLPEAISKIQPMCV